MLRWFLVGFLVGGVLGFYVGRVTAPSPPACLVVSPTDTVPSRLSLAMTIGEDQNASDEKSSTVLKFSSLDSPGTTNCVKFSYGETVTCENDGSGLLQFDPTNKLAYATRVGPMTAINRYACKYQWTGGSTIIDVPKGTQLNPHYIPGGTFTVRYTPDNDSALLQNCTVGVVAKDGSQTLAGSSMSEVKSNGIYTTTDISTSGLSGPGTIVITRTCTFNGQQLQIPFSSTVVTYTSTATLPVTWNPTDP